MQTPSHSLKKGGVCIFVHNSLNFVGTDLEKFYSIGTANFKKYELINTLMQRILV